MFISRIYIKNYRSIKELSIEFSPGKNIIVGKNNAGKSNIIKAINIVLGENSPTWAKSENITEDDFYSWEETENGGNAKQSASEIFIWCELERSAKEDLNFEEINKCSGFCIFPNESNEPRRIRKDILPFKFERIFIYNNDVSYKKWIGPKYRYTFIDELSDKYSFAFAFRAIKNDDEEITKEIRFLYRENGNSDWVISNRASIRNELLQSAIIPSFRDPQNQLRLTKWNWYGKLMRALTSNHARSKELIDAFDGIKTVGDEIFEDARAKIEESSLKIAFPDTKLHFQFSVDSKSELYKNCSVYVDDGFKSPLTEKGSGIQSATIIGLFSYYVNHVNTVTSALLCVEEPELYLHPHACRVISDRLDDFLNDNRNQVIITTHSTEFIRTTLSDLNIILVHKDGNGTTAVALNVGKFKGVLINKNYNELFFADKVIICEGYDEFIISAIANEYFPHELDDQNISIIAAGSKDNIDKLVELVIKLRIKCFVIADFDYLLRDSSNECKEIGGKIHKQIINLGKNYFSQPYICGNRAVDRIREIQSIREELKKENKIAFYKEKTSSSFKNPRLPKLLDDLIEDGICILSGEIENLSEDHEFISPSKKLSLNKIYELNARLANGEKIYELFDCYEIAKFIDIVLKK